MNDAAQGFDERQDPGKEAFRALGFARLPGLHHLAKGGCHHIGAPADGAVPARLQGGQQQTFIAHP